MILLKELEAQQTLQTQHSLVVYKQIQQLWLPNHHKMGFHKQSLKALGVLVLLVNITIVITKVLILVLLLSLQCLHMIMEILVLTILQAMQKNWILINHRKLKQGVQVLHHKPVQHLHIQKEQVP